MAVQYLEYCRPPRRELPVTVFQSVHPYCLFWLTVCIFHLANHFHQYLLLPCYFFCQILFYFSVKILCWFVVGLECLKVGLVWTARVPVSRPRDEVSRVSP